MAQEVKGLIEWLARFVKERELKGVAEIFLKNGRLILERILYRYWIDLTYSLLTEGLSTQVTVILVTAGVATGFTLYWFSAGASLVATPALLSVLVIRTIAQRIQHLRDYYTFKKLVNKILEEDKLQKIIQSWLKSKFWRLYKIENKRRAWTYWKSYVRPTWRNNTHQND